LPKVLPEKTKGGEPEEGEGMMRGRNGRDK